MIHLRVRGFTIVEVIIVVVVVGILASLSIFAFTQVQRNVRNDQRAADIAELTSALEKYHHDHNAYPSCSAMTQSVSTVASLLGVSQEALTAPTATAGTNSVTCSLLNGTSGPDVYAYVGDSTTQCTSNTYCFEFTLQYRQDGTGTIITTESLYCGQYSTSVCARPAS
jgi:prepilin-type N-terminal cleavage/methylation domain-containing protein